MMEDKLTKSFGANLAQLRLGKKLTQEQLAYICNFDRTYIGTPERGEKCPTLKTLKKLADGLSISLSALVDFKIEE